jgi:acyl-CoA thioester hydrolase
MRQKIRGYFEKIPGSPDPISLEIKRRVSFNEVDIMGIAWYGQYAIYFEQAQTELGRKCGLTFQDYYVSDLRAPIVKFHIDYYQPLMLDEEFTVRAAYVWSEGAKLHIEYTIIKEDGSIASRGYTVQMFIDSHTNQPYIVSPELLEKLRKKWKEGSFKCLKQKP